MSRLRRVTPRRTALALVLASLTAGTAWAFWTTPTAPGSNGSAAAATVNRAGAPSATAQGSTVTVSWPAATLSSGAQVTGYRVSRYPAGSATAATVGAGCSDVITTTTCAEDGVPDGGWTYTVTAVVGDSWRGQESPASSQVVVDITGPTGGSVDATGLNANRYSSTQTLSVAFSPGTDPNEIAATGARLLRAQAALSNNGCGPYGVYAVVTGGEDPVSPKSDTVPSGSACYRYQYVAKDTFGNATTYTSADVKVDTSASTAPTLTYDSFSNASTTTVSGATTVWYRPGIAGTFRVKANSTDLGSGILSYGWPSFSTGWTRSGGTTAASVYSWTAGPAQPGAQQVTATNRAGLVSGATTFTVTADSTAPTGSTIQYADGLTTADTVVVTTSTGTDDQSGVGVRFLQRAAAPLTDGSCGTFGSFTTVVHGTDPRPTREDQVSRNSCYVYRHVVRDAVGNEEVATSPSVVKVVDSSYARAVRTTSGLTSYWRLGDSPQLKDSFDGTAGATLQSRASEDGTTWTRHAAISTVDTVLTAAGRVRRNGTSQWYDGSVYYSSVEPGRGDYTVEADVYVASNVTNDAVGVIGRYDPSSNGTAYVAGYDQATQAWSLSRYVNGNSYLLAASPAQALTPGRTYRLGLDLRGATLRLILDGEQLLSVTDASPLQVGTAGFGSGYSVGGASAALTDTTGMHLDNFRISPPAADAVGTNPGTFLGAALRVLGAIASDVDTAAALDGVDDTVTMTTTTGTETSLELWFRSAGGSGSGTTWQDATPIASADVPGTDDFGVSLAASGQLVAGSGSGTPGVVTAGSVADNAWHHVVVTRSESAATLQLYVDGTLQGATPITVPVTTGPTTLRLGRGIDLSRGHFGGQVDEVAWYGTVLSDQTVAAHRLAAQ